MRFDMDNPHLEIEPVYDDVLIRFRDSRIVSEDHISRIEGDLLKLGEAAVGGTIILDFSKVRFLSSSFLGLLVKLNNTLAQGKGRLRLRNLHPDIFKVFKVTGLHKLFTIENK